jgi:hypothetical protein
MTLSEDAVTRIANFLERKRSSDVANILLAPKSEHWFNAESFVALNKDASLDGYVVYGEQTYGQISKILGTDLPRISARSQNRADLVAATPTRGFAVGRLKSKLKPPEVMCRADETLPKRIKRIQTAFKKAHTRENNEWKTHWEIPFVIEAKLLYGSETRERRTESLKTLCQQLQEAKKWYKTAAAIGILYLVCVQGHTDDSWESFHALISKEVASLFAPEPIVWIRKASLLQLRDMPKHSPKPGFMKTSFREFPIAWVCLGMGAFAIYDSQ